MDHLEHARYRAEDYSKEGYEKVESWIPIIAHALIAIAGELRDLKMPLREMVNYADGSLDVNVRMEESHDRNL